MIKISPSAIVSTKATLGENVSVGHNSLIEDDVVVGNDVEIANNVTLNNGTRVANGCKLSTGVCLSTIPHDLRHDNKYSICEIGDNTIIREYTTVSHGTQLTRKSSIGKNCFIMAYVHIPHDTTVGNGVIISNGVHTGGHVEIGDFANIGGIVGIHQFTRVGAYTFVAFHSRVTQDVPPYIMSGGWPAKFKGLNITGLQRNGFSKKQIDKIKEAYDLIYNSKYNFGDAVKAVEENVEQTNEVKNIIEFIKTSERGIIRK